MKIELVNKNSDNYSKLLAFVEKHNVFFSSMKWTSIYSSDNLHQCAILNNNNDVIGCFVYYSFKKSVFKFIITPPYSPNIDLFYVNPAVSIVGANSFNKDLIQLLVSYFESLKVPYININLPYDVIDTQPFIWEGFTSKVRYTYLINLSLEKEKLWDNLSSEKRKSVNKAIKDKVVVKETQDYKLVYSLILKSLERNDKNRNPEILENILFSFSNAKNSFAFVAYNNDVAIGATYCVFNKEKAIYLFGGFDSENKHHGAGVQCMWYSILKARELNLKYFDFEGSMNANIERYFREFGGELKPYFCIEKIRPTLNSLLNLKGHKPF
ncbi:GNAT family N-acetyltransferase [Aurantibacillus circumpalustris]|uniref:GNAT family N-acetyltransferase n=1 Tax=Aurantibacillus circumpalustris TaxID=3036359 RepID=UPI00295C0238|nr:GNAT family N-acetyltransferase [Aurantibacillus circumpalustris]